MIFYSVIHNNLFVNINYFVTPIHYRIPSLRGGCPMPFPEGCVLTLAPSRGRQFSIQSAAAATLQIAPDPSSFDIANLNSIVVFQLDTNPCSPKCVNHIEPADDFAV